MELLRPEHSDDGSPIVADRDKSWPYTLMTKQVNSQRSRTCLVGRNKVGLSLSSCALLSQCGTERKMGNQHHQRRQVKPSYVSEA